MNERENLAKSNKIEIFEDFKVRKYFNEEKEAWYFSVIDIVAALISQKDYKKAKSYWTTLKNRLKKEGSEVVTNCDRLKMLAQDGKMRQTDVADVKTILRLVQSVPSKKAEPIKLWLAKVGYERVRLSVVMEIELLKAEILMDRIQKDILKYDSSFNSIGFDVISFYSSQI